VSRRIILDLCGGTGSWSKPFADAGYDVRLVTLPAHDVRTYEPPRNVYGVLAAPPCDQFSRTLGLLGRPGDTARGMEVVDACMRVIDQCRAGGRLKFWALENPVGKLVDFIGRPAFVFQPWEFGDPWTKRTGIWGEFAEPKKKFKAWAEVPQNRELYIRPLRDKPNMIWLHKSAQASIRSFRGFVVDTDAAFRAITPQGFARAFFRANA